MKKAVLGLALIAAIGIVGCGTLGGPNNGAFITTLIMNQLSATLDSVEIALTELRPGTDDKTLHDIQIAMKIAKPQIISWIDTITQIQAASAEYNRAVDLRTRANDILPKIDAVIDPLPKMGEKPSVLRKMGLKK